MLEILLGVISGVLTTGLLVLAAFIFNKGIAPWYQRFIYKGVQIEGSWIGKKETNGAIFTLKLDIKQSAHKIVGDAVVLKKAANGQEIIRSSCFKGELWEGFLNGTLRSTDRTRLSFGSLLFKVCNGGSILKGRYLFRNTANDEIAEFDFILGRENKI